MAEIVATDLNFYVKCAKPLVLNLPSPRDRTLAAVWIKHLIEDTTISEGIKSSYLKLLLYLLQKRELDIPFSEHPYNVEVSKDQNVGTNSFLQRSGIFKIVQPRLRAKKRQHESAQQYYSDFSGDLRTYVAHQEIENLGVHCYYAMSNQPLPAWERFDKNLFPARSSPAGTMANLLEQEGKKPSSSTAEKDANLEQKKYALAEKLQEKARAANKKKTLKVPPIGKTVESDDDRVPPSWGSNLIQVQDLD